MLVDVGHQVRKGDLLGRLDDRQLRAQVELLAIRAASEAAERIAKAQFDEADAKFQATKKANDTSMHSVSDLEAKTYSCQRERFAFEVKKAREETEAAQKNSKRQRSYSSNMRSAPASTARSSKCTNETGKQSNKENRSSESPIAISCALKVCARSSKRA